MTDSATSMTKLLGLGEAPITSFAEIHLVCKVMLLVCIICELCAR